MSEYKQLDKTDNKIVNLLMKKGRMTVKDIAKEVFLSSPSVCVRLNRLEKDNVITGYTAILNDENLGYLLHAFIQIDTKMVDKQPLYDEVKSFSEVMSCYHVAGDYAVMLEVRAENMKALEKLIARFQNYGKVKTNIIFSKIEL